MNLLFAKPRVKTPVKPPSLLTASEVFQSTALFLTEAHWCRGSLARDDKEQPCGSWSPCATSFCMMGALKHTARLRFALPAEAIDNLLALLSDRRFYSGDELAFHNTSLLSLEMWFNDEYCDDRKGVISKLHRIANSTITKRLVFKQGVLQR